MRKILAFAAALALLSTQAFAQLAYAPSQQGSIGNKVSGTDTNGNAGRFILPGVTLTDSSGVEKGTTANPVTVQGNVASGTADSGNPVKVGCVYNTTALVLTNGQRGDCQADVAGGLRLWGSGVSGSGGGNNMLQTGGVDLGFNYRAFRTDTSGYQIVGHVAPGTSVTGSSGNVANASAVATLPGAASKTTWITGFQCTAAGATAAAVVNATVTGAISGTMTYTFAYPAGATAGATPLQVTFPTPVAASAANTAIVVTLPAGGAGNTNAACTAQGFQL